MYGMIVDQELLRHRQSGLLSLRTGKACIRNRTWPVLAVFCGQTLTRGTTPFIRKVGFASQHT